MAISNYFRTLIVATLAGMMTLLVAAAEPARAAFPGANGKLVFDSVPPGEADSEIVTLFYKPGGAVPEDPSPPLTDNTSNDSGAAWSPNGKRIAFVSERDGDLDIWMMKPVPETNSTGNNFPQNLTDDSGSGAFDSDPAWSPLLADGSTRIAFHRNGDIWTVNPDNIAQKDQITNEPTGTDSFPNWSPNGKRIVFQSNRKTDAFPDPTSPGLTQDSEIYTIKAAEPENSTTNEPRRLTDNMAQDTAPAWSPEGSHIAFMSDRRDNNFEIWVMSTLSDDNAVRLTNNRGIDEYPDWQPRPRR